MCCAKCLWQVTNHSSVFWLGDQLQLTILCNWPMTNHSSIFWLADQSQLSISSNWPITCSAVVRMERGCHSDRCRGRDFHIVRKKKKLGRKTRTQMKRNRAFYSKWTRWSQCSAYCLTTRVKSCRFPTICGSVQVHPCLYHHEKVFDQTTKGFKIILKTMVSPPQCIRLWTYGGEGVPTTTAKSNFWCRRYCATVSIWLWIFPTNNQLQLHSTVHPPLSQSLHIWYNCLLHKKYLLNFVSCSVWTQTKDGIT